MSSLGWIQKVVEEGQILSTCNVLWKPASDAVELDKQMVREDKEKMLWNQNRIDAQVRKAS